MRPYHKPNSLMRKLIDYGKEVWPATITPLIVERLAAREMKLSSNATRRMRDLVWEGYFERCGTMKLGEWRYIPEKEQVVTALPSREVNIDYKQPSLI